MPSGGKPESGWVDFQRAAVDLVALHRLEQGTEVTFAEALAVVALALDELEEHRAEQRLGEDRPHAHGLPERASRKALRLAQAQSHGRVPRVGPEMAGGRGMPCADRRHGLSAAGGRQEHGSLLSLRARHAAQAPQRAGLQDKLRAGSGKEHHGLAL
ncbi:UNVERIFIED_CONTAM: hypothetical protein NCL1_39273 [Trichonephila clavipes]